MSTIKQASKNIPEKLASKLNEIVFLTKLK